MCGYRTYLIVCFDIDALVALSSVHNLVGADGDLVASCEGCLFIVRISFSE